MDFLSLGIGHLREIAAPKIKTTIRVNPIVNLTSAVNETALFSRAAIAGMSAEAVTTATARAISRTSTALVPFGEVIVGLDAGTAAVGAEAAAAGIGAAAGAGEIGAAAVGAATIPETIVIETGAASLLGKIVALGKSVWALAAAHPVIAIATVATAIIVPTLILIAYRKNTAKNVIIPQGDEVPQSDL
ncbi:MAG: hypothetical protein LBD34_00945 [Puniceicoccales bacterium]|nr:hypothetical protein [Puniceicoccales bacterium]